MPVFKIHHITKYQYDRPVKESVSQLRIFPPSDSRQALRQFELIITTDPQVERFKDYYGNEVGDFDVLAPHQQLTIDSRLTVETFPKPEPVLGSGISIQELQKQIASDINLLRLATPEKIQSQAAIDSMLKDFAADSEEVIDMAWKCNEMVYRNFRYEKGITSVETTVDEILEHHSGVCQDFAHVLLQMLRTMGIPSRYVSGYICPNKSGMRGEGATHAWIEFYIPGTGWIGLDPTNNVWVDGYHVILATGHNFNDCTPVKGTFKGIAQQVLSVYVSVGYEDGHVFEDVNQVKMQEESAEGLEPWQTDWMQAQQQQQQ